MIPMQMEPQAIMSLGSKEQGCMWDADRKVEAGEQGFQAQPGKQGLRWMRLCLLYTSDAADEPCGV